MPGCNAMVMAHHFVSRCALSRVQPVRETWIDGDHTIALHRFTTFSGILQQALDAKR